MVSATPASKMTYRFLGNSGLLVSKFALGSWMFRDEKNTVDAWYEMMKTAFSHGVNLFDSAENYALGRADELMGGAIQKGIADGVWSREDLVVTAKIFSGTKGFTNGTPNSQGLNRKHLIEGTQASLGSMGLEYVDVIFCHHPDAFTPIEETVRAMNYIIEQGWAFYWDTSNWSIGEIMEACEIADRLGLIRIIVEQSQYSILERNRVEFELEKDSQRVQFGWFPSTAIIEMLGEYNNFIGGNTSTREIRKVEVRVQMFWQALSERSEPTPARKRGRVHASQVFWVRAERV
ncbi:hypothetical protein PF010_g7118 [Phytophthora fragariae]|uniref:NADP-dependent oxidoreductase domain-containing protein n=1 Tax=Phytophthora fragariae TaxID=53985 RepID=A0A6A3STN8_9STRA|nr:hypothetical protein PF003_g20318 [Phytophthora fragariae]KAE8942678.1 hypothetical protein PF009_g7562 [Phytophthora fragariae]KAE9121412.1 hypothetical protein PF010_g7118 [Phytophthora fragariae]KAE9123066.1 hypothetical protein PF007_g7195 [Phytophthora fragariae]KAE9149721.1 hypothetical protein PF006_g5810 [Phytophthora fragariae]